MTRTPVLFGLSEEFLYVSPAPQYLPPIQAFVACCSVGPGTGDLGQQRPCLQETLGGRVVGHELAKQPLARKIIAAAKQGMKCSGNTRGTPQSQPSCVHFCFFFKESICLSPRHPTCTSELEFSMFVSLRLALISQPSDVSFWGHSVPREGHGGGRVWTHPHTKGRLHMQISELKNRGVLRALTAEANGWEPAGKVPFRALGAWVGPKSELPVVYFSSFEFLSVLSYRILQIYHSSRRIRVNTGLEVKRLES